MIFLCLCLVHLLHVVWNNFSGVFLFKIKWYQCFHTKQILIVRLVLSSSTCRRCHGACVYFRCQFQFMSRQWVSRDATRTRDTLHTRQRGGGGVKWIKYVIVGQHMLSVCATNHHPKKTPTLESYRCTLRFLLCLIPCVTTSTSVTLIICTWAQNFCTHISHSTLKLLRCGKCSVLVGGRFQRNFFSMRW